MSIKENKQNWSVSVPKPSYIQKPRGYHNRARTHARRAQVRHSSLKTNVQQWFHSLLNVLERIGGLE